MVANEAELWRTLYVRDFGAWVPPVHLAEGGDLTWKQRYRLEHDLVRHTTHTARTNRHDTHAYNTRTTPAHVERQCAFYSRHSCLQFYQMDASAFVFSFPNDEFQASMMGGCFVQYSNTSAGELVCHCERLHRGFRPPPLFSSGAATLTFVLFCSFFFKMVLRSLFSA